MRFRYLFVFLAIFYCLDSHSQIKNEDDLKKQAEKHFEDEDYNLAYKLYSQLVSLYPKDPDYNYKLGVCMLYTEPDKKKPFIYFQIALKNPANAPKDVKFYLAKTYHINYRFDEAIKLYTEYKQIGSASSIKKLQVDREIQACKNGKRLLSNLSDLVVISKKQLNEADYFKGYDVKEIGGKILVKPDEYKSVYDKKKKDKSVVYLPRSGERLYYSSYGENGNTGRDIYFVNKLPNGSWSKAQILPSTINTEYDEDYPFLHPNGKTLYFSSKGHNSMGGYDVFKTTFNNETQTWSKPENLEFPINSPDDDILFITDSLEKLAFFSTGRYSPYGKLDVLKINTERRPMNFAVVKGTIVKEEVAQSIKSKITVKDLANGEIVGTYQTHDNGDYSMELPNGGKFIFTVETPGITTQSDGVELPVAYSLKPYKQIISYDKKVMKITNYFDGTITDENYSMMIDLIEKKAKLDVNENELNSSIVKDIAKNKNVGDEPKNLNSVSTTNPTVGSDELKNNTNKNVTNEQLLSIAKEDAKEASDEALKLKQEAQDAFGLATQKTAEAVAKQKDAEQAIENANNITDVTKKNEELAKANQLKEDAKIASGVATTATNMAKKLEVDASIQQKEADLTNQYINQLEEVTKNKNNKEALTKLEGIQKELDNLSKQKNQSDELFTSLKAESELKQQELTNSEKKSNSLVNEIKTIKNESENLEKDLVNENDKSLKENISAQIRELNSEIEIKNQELVTNNQKNTVLKNEVDGVNQELQIAAKMLNEKTGAVVTNNIVSANAASLNSTSNDAPTKIISANNENTNSVTSASITPKNKSRDNVKPEALINEAETLNSKAYELRKESATKTGSEKEELIKQASENEKLATDKKLEASVIFQKENKAEFENSTANIIELKKLINNQPSGLGKIEISEANTLTNEAALNFKQAQEIRKEAQSNTSVAAKLGGLSNAEEKENEAIAKQQKAIALLNKVNPAVNIKSSEEPVKINEPIVATKTDAVDNPQALINEAESLNNKAYELRKESATKNGSEKEELIKQATENENLASDKKLLASSIFQKENKTSFENSTANLNELKKLTGTKTSTEISQANTLIDEATLNFKQAQEIRNEAENNTSVAAKLGGLSNAEEKEIEAITKQQKAIALLNVVNAPNTEKSSEEPVNSNEPIVATKNDLVTNPEALINEAENLNNKAYELRKESATKNGSEKEELIKQATENEKAATDKKLQASVIYQKENKQNFENNSFNLTEIQKLTGDKSSNEISQANMLVDEAALNFKQAQKIRSESESYPNGAARLGGLGNAEEKENEAIAKQQKALVILSKVSPAYKVKPIDTNASSPDAIVPNNTDDATKKSDAQIDTYITESKSNQNELTSKNDLLIKNPAFSDPGNKQAQELKATSDKLNNESKELINQSLAAKNPTEKIELLSKANEKEKEALKILTEATDLMKENNITVNTSNNSTTTNTVSSNTNTNTTATTTPVNNESNLTSQTNTVAVNNDASKNNITANTSNETNANETISDNSNSINSKGVGDEITKLKTGINNSNETQILNFTIYTNSEAAALNNKGTEKINAALNEDKKLNTDLENINQLPAANTTGITINEQSISLLITEADKLNDDALALRKLAATKTDAERENDINTAKTLEENAISKKLNAADEQKQMNRATFEANKQSLEELAVLAKGKNISELEMADMQTNEANLFFKQADKLREEASTYPSDGSKLGGYNNAEEKEYQSIFKQQALLDIYKKYFTNYVPKKPSRLGVTTDSPEAIDKLKIVKTNAITNTQLHVDGLNLLVQANEIEYKNRFLNLPATLNPSQTSSKTKAQAAYKKTQEILTQAYISPDLTNKKNLLIEATKTGQEAIIFLNQISVPNTVASNNAKNTTAPSNTSTNTNSSKSNTTNTTSISIAKLKVEGLEVKNTNAYTAAKPIPIDEKIPDGLVFKVQIGAFKTPLPNNTFKGLSPVIAQSTPSGYIRYMAGNFEQYASANAVKNDLRNLGYSDAFVVAYLNGKRINLNEATDKAKAVGQVIETTINTSAGLTSNANVPKNTFATPTNNTSDSQPVVVANELEKMNGLLYTVQIGVYSKQTTRSQLFNLKPIYTEQLPNGLYRYTAGIYNQSSKLLEDKRKVVALGVKDAFVSSYYNAKRIPFAEGQKLQTENTNLKMESESPIVFPGAATAPVTNSVIVVDMNTISQPTNVVTSTVTAFSNGVLSEPTPTPENGVKNDDAGISYKVQIGAYRNQVPNDIASKFLNIKTWPVKNVVINGLFIYTIGNFNGLAFAKKLKDEAISFGISDAYITVYKDGKKLYGTEATQYLGN